MKTNLLLFAVPVVILAVVFGLQQQDYSIQPVNQSAARLTKSMPDVAITDVGVFSQELGEIPMSAGIAQLGFTFKNTSDTPLDLQQLYTTCMCTKAKIITQAGQSAFAGMQGHTGGLKPIDPNLQLQPGEEAVVLVEFDPNAHGPDAVGPITRSVILETNQADAEFMFSGVVIK